MSRLIDADALIDYLGFGNTEEEREENVGEIVTLEDFDNQPTAFDVDKVLEQLENYLFEKYCIEGDAKIDEIVKGVGAE